MSLLAPEEGFDQLLLGEDHGVVLLDKIELSGISGKLQIFMSGSWTLRGG